MRYVVAYITGPDSDTTPSTFQNAVMHNPMVLNSDDDNYRNIVNLYKANQNINDFRSSINAFLLVGLKDNVNVSKEMIASSLGEEFTYEKILYTACLPNSIFNGRISIVTNENLPIENIKLPCVYGEHTRCEWSAILDI